MCTAELKARLDTYCSMADSSSALAVQQGSLADSDSDGAHLCQLGLWAKGAIGFAPGGQGSAADFRWVALAFETTLMVLKVCQKA